MPDARRIEGFRDEYYVLDDGVRCTLHLLQRRVLVTTVQLQPPRKGHFLYHPRARPILALEQFDDGECLAHHVFGKILVQRLRLGARLNALWNPALSKGAQELKGVSRVIVLVA